MQAVFTRGCVACCLRVRVTCSCVRCAIWVRPAQRFATRGAHLPALRRGKGPSTGSRRQCPLPTQCPAGEAKVAAHRLRFQRAEEGMVAGMRLAMWHRALPPPPHRTPPILKCFSAGRAVHMPFSVVAWGGMIPQEELVQHFLVGILGIAFGSCSGGGCQLLSLTIFSFLVCKRWPRSPCSAFCSAALSVPPSPPHHSAWLWRGCLPGSAPAP